ncbi:unnamed protein product [Phaedon cochleariae]|uniref:Uncharacterized protein n=1 Tax=Phaedon cochleariae TaxID=80249 RepID=A0A9N9SGX3_PHACE|nr:unnamed protein product [Phaedon cochleariae]
MTGRYEKKHHQDDGDHAEHPNGEKGENGHKYSEKGSYKKGYSTKRGLGVHKNDQYKKEKHFLDEYHDFVSNFHITGSGQTFHNYRLEIHFKICETGHILEIFTSLLLEEERLNFEWQSSLPEDTNGHYHDEKIFHKKHFEEHDRYEDKHHQDDGDHAEHPNGEKGENGHKYSEKVSYKKGYSTKRGLGVHKNDQYKKGKHFLDEYHDFGKH